MKDLIINIWPMLTIFVVIISLVRIVNIKINHREFVFYKEFSNLCFLIYALLLFRLVTYDVNGAGTGLNLVPFKEITRYSLWSYSFLKNVVLNIIVFLPFGYFVSCYIRAKKIRYILLITILSSGIIELVQLQINRSFDIDDILLNIVGSIIGYFVYRLLGFIKRHLPSFLQSNWFYNLFVIVIITIIILAFLKFNNIWWFV